MSDHRTEGIRQRLDGLVEKGILRDWWTNTGYPGRRWHLEGSRESILSERSYTTSQVEDFLTGALSAWYTCQEQQQPAEATS